MPFLLLGVLLWFAGLPLSGLLATGRVELRNPFTLTGGRAAWSSEPDAAQEGGRLTQIGRTAIANAADLAVGMFREARVVSHREFLPEPGPLPARTVPWTVAVFGPLGAVVLARRRADPGAAVLLAWLVVTPLPVLLAVEAYPKCAATLFPALICAVAVFIAWLISAAWPQSAGCRRRAAWVVVGVALGLQVALTCCYWFSGRQWPSGRPSEIAVARHVADHLVRGTLVIVDGDLTYLDCKLLFLLLEDLGSPGRRPNASVIFEGDTEEFRRLVERPAAALAYLDEIAWPYRWTRLARQRDEIAATRKWQRVIWVIAVRSRPDVRPNLQHVPLVRASCPDVRERSFPGGGVSGAPHDVTVLVCRPPTRGVPERAP